MMKIRVLLVDDHTVIREGLRAMLTSAEDIEVVGEASDGWEAVRLAQKTAPMVILMDVAMPSLNGLGALREILKKIPDAKVMVLSSYDGEDCVAQLMEAGASGYLIKQTAATELLTAIREVHKGRLYLSPAIVRQWRNRNGSKGDDLTLRELETLKLVALGLSNKEAAAELGISIKTVEKHRQQVMNKLNIHECAGLTRFALSKGLVQKTDTPEQLHSASEAGRGAPVSAANECQKRLLDK